MSKMLKAELVAENIALRAHANQVETALASRTEELTRSVKVSEGYRQELRLSAEQIVHLTSRINDLEMELGAATVHPMHPDDYEERVARQRAHHVRLNNGDCEAARSEELVGKPWRKADGTMWQKVRTGYGRVLAHRQIGH